MFNKAKISNLDDFFINLNERGNNSVYFYRIAHYNSDVETFLVKYAQKAMRLGVIIDGKIQNPNEKQLSYYNEIMGLGFEMNINFFKKSLYKWMPRINSDKLDNISQALYTTLNEIKLAGKNDSIIKNIYIKFMCWFYYKFERVLNFIGNDVLPKILYVGDISVYELKMLDILSNSGCDIVILEINGDEYYSKIDSGLKYSYIYNCKGQAFPSDYSADKIIKKAESDFKISTLYNNSSTKICSTNTWISGEVFDDCIKPFSDRGDDKYIYNMFVKVEGVYDKVSYLTDIFKWKTKLEDLKRKVVVINNIQPPSTDEISKFNGNYNSTENIIKSIVPKISTGEFKDYIIKAFVDVINNENDTNINRIKNKAIYLAVYFERYNIFKGCKKYDIPVFIYFGICKNKFEALFIKFLSYMPVDVFVINTDLSRDCILEDKRLFVKKFDLSLKAEKFPESIADIKYTTTAYNAERELDTLLYQDSGIYRDRQHKTAMATPIQTMYEEIYILWSQELKYRPNFDIIDKSVIMPTIICKVSGVKNSDINSYWADIKKLMTKETILIDNIPFTQRAENTNLCVSFLKNRKLQRDKIKNSPIYKFGIFREETQEYILDKLQLVIDSQIIKGTFVNGTEFTIISVILNIDVKIARLIQNFDFTKINPKIIALSTDDKLFSLEDSIVILFLYFIGFDIALFVPTGYRIIENHYTKNIFNNYDIGDFMYDIVKPDLYKYNYQAQKKGIIEKLFRRE